MRQIDFHKEFDLTAKAGTERPVSPVLLAVLRDFHQKRIAYCYWKSSSNVPSVLTGESDLDLFIARKDQHRCQIILLERGLKLFPSISARDHPAILSFLGFDDLTGRLIHIHLHFRLVAGARLLKNYCLPWSGTILARAIQHPTLPIKVLDPTSEALLLIVRGCLDLRRSDPVTLRHWAATTDKFAKDRERLAAQVDRQAFHDLANEMMGAMIADKATEALYGDRPLQTQRALRHHVERHLAPYRTYNMVETHLRAGGRAMTWIAGGINKQWLHLPRPWSRRAPGGGVVVAIVGVDGSGKSSVVAAISAWLGSEIDTVPMYFGTGDGRPSLLLRPFKMAMPFIARMLPTRPKGASHGKISDRQPGILYRTLLTVWATVVAREKRGKLLVARRGANRGLVVLTDRYPQNEVIGFNDGPLLVRLAGVPQWLRRFEDSTYTLARRLPPDLVIKLQVTPATAAEREPNMDPAVIRERIDTIQHLNFAAQRVVTVNAERPLAEVIQIVKSEIWRLL
jgi:thymidylate kinase